MVVFAAKVVILLAAFGGMEVFAWGMHRYVMHGALWCWHRSHHEPRDGVFELNDLFAVIFAMPAILFIWLGVNVSSWWLPLGLGITAYGAAYAVFHDGLVHRRFPVPLDGRRSFWRSRVQAHRIHHVVVTREGCVSFGFLWVRPLRELKLKLAAARDRSAPGLDEPRRRQGCVGGSSWFPMRETCFRVDGMGLPDAQLHLVWGSEGFCSRGCGEAMTTVSVLRESDSTRAIDLADASAVRRTRVELRLKKLLPPADAAPRPLTDAVRDICLGPGKRVRPTLAMLSSAHFGGCELAALDYGCALELIHAASLVLDDLPCMDDATMRRGKVTLHRRFGEDTAVLSAVALLNHAYGIIAGDATVDFETRLALIALLSETVGFRGLVSGQFRDLRDPESFRDELTLTSLNHQKTGVLFAAAMVGGAMIAGADQAAQAQARLFANRLGLAFQLWDDLQDSVSTCDATGKDVRKDDRVTFVTLWGEERTRAAIAETIDEALANFGDRSCPVALYALNLFHHAGYGG